MRKKTERIIEKNKSVEIMDHIYDIHKVEKQKKYESSSAMKKLKIGNNIYEGTLDILDGMESKIKSEVEEYDEDQGDGPTEEELDFLLEMENAHFTEDEKQEIIRKITEE